MRNTQSTLVVPPRSHAIIIHDAVYPHGDKKDHALNTFLNKYFITQNVLVTLAGDVRCERTQIKEHVAGLADELAAALKVKQGEFTRCIEAPPTMPYHPGMVAAKAMPAALFYDGGRIPDGICLKHMRISSLFNKYRVAAAARAIMNHYDGVHAPGVVQQRYNSFYTCRTDTALIISSIHVALLFEQIQQLDAYTNSVVAHATPTLPLISAHIGCVPFCCVDLDTMNVTNTGQTTEENFRSMLYGFDIDAEVPAPTKAAKAEEDLTMLLM
jgi:hypothetical protein